MAEHCDLCELPKAWCVHGKPVADIRTNLAAFSGVTFTAKYDGRCADCDHGFQAGELIGRTDDGVDLHVEVDGDPGSPLTVVLSHGFTARLAEWELQRTALRERARLAEKQTIRSIVWQ
mgnify:CR=1 FL=1